MPLTNDNLNRAGKNKNDEFYTDYKTIESEMNYYTKHFKNKIVLCNCNDLDNNFHLFFRNNFEKLGLKKLIVTSFSKDKAYKLIIDGEKEEKIELKGNGDFRSPECMELLKEADIVVTNPPFSLFREYLVQLMEYDKKFIVLGNHNAVTYNFVFDLIKQNEIRLGLTKPNGKFTVPKEYKSPNNTYNVDEKGVKYVTVPVIWITNLEHGIKNKPLKLWDNHYQKYDNYDAIEVSNLNLIPAGYKGVMGVPTSYLLKYCPEQFEILNIKHDACLNGKIMFCRVFIKAKQ